ncbi:MAG: HEPN domain-containing protein [Methanobacteriota archaeon]
MTAEYALTSEEVFPDIICFHAQQSAEKCLKALIVKHEDPVPRTHNLGNLVSLIAEWDFLIMDILDDALLLTPYAIESRYPDTDTPSYEDAKEAIESANRIRDLVMRRSPFIPSL